MTGNAPTPGHALDAGYFYRNIREPVRYLHALRAMVKEGFRCFVEIGPHPALSRGTIETLRSVGVQGTVIPSLRRDGDDDRQLHALLAQLFVAGAACEATSDAVVPHIALPRQPMERRRFWLETAEGRSARLRPRGADHPHLRGLRAGAHASEVLSCDLDLDVRTQPYLGEHKVQGTVVFPAAGQLELVSSLTRLGSRSDVVVLENVELRRPIMAAVSKDDDTSFRLDFYGDDGSFVLVSRAGQADAPWVEHSRGRAGRIDQAIAELSQSQIAELRRRRDAGAFEETSAVELYRSSAPPSASSSARASAASRATSTTRAPAKRWPRSKHRAISMAASTFIPPCSTRSSRPWSRPRCAAVMIRIACSCRIAWGA